MTRPHSSRLRVWADRARDHRGATVRDGRAVVETRTAIRSTKKWRLRFPKNLNRSALLDALDLLGIKRPVRIIWADPDDMAAPEPGYRMNGEHEFTPDGTHLIKLLRGRSAEATARTLLHELAHALQAEGYGSRAKWARAKLDHAERFEAEADEIARVLGHLKLVS